MAGCTVSYSNGMPEGLFNKLKHIKEVAKHTGTTVAMVHYSGVLKD